MRVNLIAVAAILLVLLVTFRSAIIPLILLFTIESAIWINMAIPYFMDMDVNYIGYLVLNTVQLGATVDYAILFTTTYLTKRRQMPAAAALAQTAGQCTKSILVSALTLSIAGFALFGMTTNPIIADIGLLLGRGTLLSMGLVLTMLPLLLKIFDQPISRLTYRSDFYV
jgi:predicted RND superfamily exporter protein